MPKFIYFIFIGTEEALNIDLVPIDTTDVILDGATASSTIALDISQPHGFAYTITAQVDGEDPPSWFSINSETEQLVIDHVILSQTGTKRAFRRNLNLNFRNR